MTPENRYPASNGSVKWRFPPVHPEGRKFSAIAAAIAVLAWLFVPWLTWPLIILTAWVLAFFRDPVRVTPRDEHLIIAPADGLVTLIQNVPPPRVLLGPDGLGDDEMTRSEEHTSELQSLMRISYAVFCLKNQIQQTKKDN